MTTSDTVADYFSHLKNGVGWESFLSDDMTFTSFTTPSNASAEEPRISNPPSASTR